MVGNSKMNKLVICTDGKLRHEYELAPISIEVCSPKRLIGIYTFNNLLEFRNFLDNFKNRSWHRLEDYTNFLEKHKWCNVEMKGCCFEARINRLHRQGQSSNE